MSDILGQIDAVLAQQCACGCGRQLAADGPSAWYASESCQERWLLGAVAPPSAGARRSDVATSRLMLTQWAGVVERVHAGTASADDREAAIVAARRLNAVLADVARQIQPIVQAYAQACVQLVAHLRAAGLLPPAPAAAFREQALARVRNRNTGPQIQQKAPVKIDPRRSR